MFRNYKKYYVEVLQLKRLISVLMSIMLVVLSVIDGFSAFALEQDDSLELDAFATKLIEMVRNHEKSIETEDELPDDEFDVDFPIEYYNTENSVINFYSNNEPTNDKKYEYDKRFSTGRLIVKSKYDIDLQGAKDCISGYKDLYILQYNTYIEAQKAYEYYKTLDIIEYVEPDITRRMQSDGEIGIPGINPDIIEDVKDEAISWVSEQIGFDDIKEELASRIQNEVLIAVLDSGVDTDHEFLDGRLIPNNINFSSSGDENSCEDDYGHGTHVAGIIVDNTLANVKIKPYKVLNNYGNGSTSLIAIAVDMAVADGADIINLSLSADGENQMLRDSIDEATAQGVNVVVAAGNYGADLNFRVMSPACVESAITVSAIDKNNKLSSYSNYNGTIDIAAPGDNVMSSYLNNTYSLMSGTSMAAPQVSAGLAIVRSVYPNKSATEAEKMIKDYAIKIEEKDGENKYGAGILYLKYILQVIPRTANVVFSVAEGTFNKKFQLTLSCPEDATILYAINLGDDIELGYLNGTKYQLPITISETTKITAIAIAKGKLFSMPITYSYERIFSSDEDKFEVSSSGYLTNYLGTEADITVPEKVRGITITGIGSNAFKNDPIVRSVHLPDTATRICYNAFYGCSNLETVTGNGITQIDSSAFQISTIENLPFNQLTKIGAYAFSGCNNLKNVDLSNAINIDSNAFENAQGLDVINGENLQTIGNFAFRNSDITKVSIPNLKALNEGAFAGCRLLEEVVAEAVANVSKAVFKDCISLRIVKLPSATTFGNEVFSGSSIKFIDLPQATTLGKNVFSNCEQLRMVSLPLAETVGVSTFSNCSKLNMVYLPVLKSVDNNLFSGCEQLKSLWLPQAKTVSLNAFDGSSIEYLQFDKVEQISNLPNTLLGLILPSTIQRITGTTPTTDFIVYGNDETYAEEYANSVGKEFRVVPYVVFDMPKQVSVDYKFIYAYALGYNCTYQWYANDTLSNEGGTPIDGATKFFYEPNREDGAIAYYCVITSNDGISETVFVTEPVENAFEYREADYTEFQNILSVVEGLDRKLYTADSLKLLDDILSVDISGCSLAEQNVVDEHVFAIQKAIDLLQFAFKLGDINDDGVITLVDARMALQAVSQTITLSDTQILATDVNEDGKISLVDARLILQAVAGVIEL